VLNEEDSRPVIKHALELGINFFDTANVYSLGTSEEILGRALRDFANRDEVVIATKLHGKMREGPNGGGLSRKAILSEIDHSLTRLGTDYVDLYIIHRWDYDTPIEETIEALHDVVRSGKARYIGASAMWAWQFQKALHVAEQHGWTRFVSMQDHLNLIYREEEREMLPLCCAAYLYPERLFWHEICYDAGSGLAVGHAQLTLPRMVPDGSRRDLGGRRVWGRRSGRRAAHGPPRPVGHRAGRPTERLAAGGDR
jgi:Aldo/keto reductase family